MDASKVTLDASTLLQHEAFVRAAVRGVLADEDRIQDVVQDTWLQALDRPPLKPGALRSWLVRVAQNFALSTRRGERRRRFRESAVALPETSESVEEAHDRLLVRQAVVAAVLDLPETYRNVVILRYERDLSTAAIAERLGRSSATVRSQLSRAHQMMRRKLNADFKDERSWALFALPAALDVAKAHGSSLPLVAAATAGAFVTLAVGFIIGGGGPIGSNVGVLSPTIRVHEGQNPQLIAVTNESAERTALGIGLGED
jgi:RNA polymerase sigma-70 factor (ECF subfamily)